TTALPRCFIFQPPDDGQAPQPQPVYCPPDTRATTNGADTMPEVETADFHEGRSTEPPDEDADRPPGWTIVIGLCPGRQSGHTAHGDDCRMGQTPEEPCSGPRSGNLLRHLRSEGGRHLPPVVLVATQEKHC